MPQAKADDSPNPTLANSHSRPGLWHNSCRMVTTKMNTTTEGRVQALLGTTKRKPKMYLSPLVAFGTLHPFLEGLFLSLLHGARKGLPRRVGVIIVFLILITILLVFVLSLTPILPGDAAKHSQTDSQTSQIEAIIWYQDRKQMSSLIRKPISTDPGQGCPRVMQKE